MEHLARHVGARRQGVSLGAECSIGANVTLRVPQLGRVVIGDDVEIVPARTVVGGYPAVAVRQRHRQTVAIARLARQR